MWYAVNFGLEPITTPAYRPQSNALARAFVHTPKRDYVHGAELRDAESLLAHLSDWFDDSNRRAPHPAPGMGPRTEYRASLELAHPSV